MRQPGTNAGCSAAAGSYLFYDSLGWRTKNNNGNLQAEAISTVGPAPLGSLAQMARGYSYDSVNRLTAVNDSSGGWNRQYGYDAWGNAWVSANSGVNLAGNTPAANVYNGRHGAGRTCSPV